MGDKSNLYLNYQNYSRNQVSKLLWEKVTMALHFFPFTGELLPSRVVMGPDQKHLTRNWWGQFFFVCGWVSHLWLGSGFGKSHLKIPNFSIFSLLLKKNLFGSKKSLQGGSKTTRV